MAVRSCQPVGSKADVLGIRSTTAPIWSEENRGENNYDDVLGVITLSTHV